jgi:hypothetical protein
MKTIGSITIFGLVSAVALLGCGSGNANSDGSGAMGAAASGGAAGSGGGAAGRGGTGGGGTGGAAGQGGGGGAAVQDGGGAGTGGRGGTGGAAGMDGGATDAANTRFSFFVTSLQSMRDLSGDQNGFGGDLRFGEATGLAGADKICATIAERSLPGAGAKTWRAFLSTVAGPVHAINRVGAGPWYDRLGRLVASTLAQLAMSRPGDADPAIKNDLPNEFGVPNHDPDGTGQVDNHDTLTGSNTTGMLFMNSMAFTCNDWTFKGDAANMGPEVGHSWPGAQSGANWMSSLREGGCMPGINLVSGGGPQPGVHTVGTGGGYGAIYCFALTP